MVRRLGGNLLELVVTNSLSASMPSTSGSRRSRLHPEIGEQEIASVRGSGEECLDAAAAVKGKDMGAPLAESGHNHQPFDNKTSGGLMDRFVDELYGRWRWKWVVVIVVWDGRWCWWRGGVKEGRRRGGGSVCGGGGGGGFADWYARRKPGLRQAAAMAVGESDMGSVVDGGGLVGRGGGGGGGDDDSSGWEVGVRGG